MVKSHIWLWLVAIFLMILAVPAVLPPELARARLDAEFTASQAIFGPNRVAEITTRANGVFEAVVGGLAIGALIQTGYVKDSEVKSKLGEGLNREASKWTNSYLQTMMLQLYGVFFRGSLMLEWLIYVGFFLVASVIDGVAQRKIKQELFQMNAPIKFAFMFHTVIAIVFSPFAYLLLPFHVTPWFMPIWSLAIAYPLSKAIANAVKTG